jgi:uncharacterized protein
VASTLCCGAACAAWGFAIEPRMLDRRHETAEIPNLPASWERRHIALLADLQVGILFSNTDTVRRAIARVIELRPALALIAGDFVYEAARRPDWAARTTLELVRPLPHAGIPTYAVLGNHDYGEAAPESQKRHLAQEVSAALEESGVRVLRNEAVPLEAGPDSASAADILYLVGLGAHAPGEDRSRAAVAAVPSEAARLVFMHNPVSFRALPAGSAPVALAGHTHGGQIRLPFAPTWSLGRLIMPWPQYVDGWIDGYGEPGNRLYVNRGIGFSRLPLRFGCPPELTVFRLAAAAIP